MVLKAQQWPGAKRTHCLFTLNESTAYKVYKYLNSYIIY